MSSSFTTTTTTTTTAPIATEQQQRVRQHYQQKSSTSTQTLTLSKGVASTSTSTTNYNIRHHNRTTMGVIRPQQQQQRQPMVLPSQETRPHPQPQPPLQQQQQKEQFLQVRQAQRSSSTNNIQTQQSPCSGSQRRRPIRTMLGNWMDRQRTLRQQRIIEREILTIQSKIKEETTSTPSTSNTTEASSLLDSSSTFQIQLEMPSEGRGEACAPHYNQLLSQEDMRQLHSYLPDVLRNSCKANTWKCCYSLFRDGDSFDTFLTNVSSYRQTLLVIQTSTNEILGGFVEEEWKHTSGGGGIVGITTTDPTVTTALGGKEFYGSGRAFLFSITKQQQSEKEKDFTTTSTSTVHVYPWTGKNRYIQYCDFMTNTIAMGGGGGSFGFVIQNNFTTGSTGRCDTFDNPPLVTTKNNDNDLSIPCPSTVEDIQLFDIVDMEVYTFVGSI